ncbi:hypothetical protein DUI87_01698 [Hirundo rustica rustica]|uniref:RNA-directed DNA polymerase n=1 Tax=Hirundo rustica rustica TaxID=333673 RepID=A0A3M0L677_HIRRU|nr:hypothetical protein DUI87_01698 [Hirundo rustica rustica]
MKLIRVSHECCDKCLSKCLEFRLKIEGCAIKGYDIDFNITQVCTEYHKNQTKITPPVPRKAVITKMPAIPEVEEQITPVVTKIGPYAIKKTGDQKLIVNPKWSLKRVEMGVQGLIKLFGRCNYLATIGWFEQLGVPGQGREFAFTTRDMKVNHMEPNSEYFVIGDCPREDKVQRMPPWKYLGLQIAARTIVPQKLEIECNPKTLADLHSLCGSLNWEGRKSPKRLTKEMFEHLLQSNASLQLSLDSYRGQISVHAPSHKSLKEEFHLIPREKRSRRPLKALTVFTDASGASHKSVMTWRNPQTQHWEADVEFVEGSPQVAELAAVAKLSHQQYHQNVPGLICQFQLTRSQARAIVATCPNCQVQAMPSMGEKTEHAKKHPVQAFSVLGIPKEIKTDNGPAYTSKGFLEFVQQWGAEHKTGIPHSPTGQAVVERAHQTLEQVLARQSSTTVWMSPHEKLCKAMFTINFLNCSFENMSPPVVRHFNSGNQFKLSQRPLVMIRDPETWETKGPYELVTWGRGYACMATPSGPRWIPQKWVKPFVPKNPAPAEGDKRQVAVASKRRRHRMEEKESS